MDHFGIGAALQGMAQMYFRSARQTGRTTSLVESVKDGDRIVFAESKEAERVRRLCLDHGVMVDCIVVDPNNPAQLFDRSKSLGRTLFDHTWVEQYHLGSIEHTQRTIDDFQRKASGSCARMESPRLNREMERWQD